MKRLGVVFGLLSVLSILVAIVSSPKDVLADSGNIWNENVSVEKAEYISSSRLLNRYDCEYKNAKVQQISGTLNYLLPGVLNIGNTTKSSIGEKCIIRNASGAFTSDFVQSIADKFILSYNYGSNSSNLFSLSPMMGANVWMDPAPYTNNAFLFSKSNYYNSNYLVYQYKDIGSGKPSVRKSSLTWDFSQTTNERWIDKNNASFMINEHAFSPNGKYMVVRYGNGNVGKVNLETLDLTPVHNNRASNYDIAISGDGKYVAVLSGKDLRVIDTSGCDLVYPKGTWNSGFSSSAFAGCDVSQNLISNAVANGFLGSTTIFKRIYFDNRNNVLNLSEGTQKADAPIGHNGSVGFYDWHEIKFIAENYESENSGYLAFGDSFSSGEGDMQGEEWYEPGTDEQGNPETFEARNLCHLSRRSYPYLMAINLGYLANNLDTPPADGLFHSVACSGAKSHNIKGAVRGPFFGEGNSNNFESRDNQYRNDFFNALDRWQPGRIKQTDILKKDVFGGYAQNETLPEVITLGIGGNDAGFGDIILSCIKPGTCKYAQEGSTATSELALSIASLKDTLSETYKSVKLSSPESRVYVHGYPVFVQGYGGNCGVNTPFDANETVFIEKGIRYMNSVVRSAAQEAGVFYVDVSDILKDRNLCSGVGDSNSTFNGVTRGNDKLSLFDNKIAEAVSGMYIIGTNCYFSSGCIGNESFHPNHLGHELYAQKILEDTVNLTSEMPEPATTAYPLPDSYFGSIATQHLVSVNEANGFISDFDITIKQPKSFLSYKDQNTVKILQNGFYPGSTVAVSHESTPTEIGQHNADETGLLDIEIEIPETLSENPGEHEIILEGSDNFGGPLKLYQQISIAENSEDFDGDGAVNELDSCVTVSNSEVDIDQDGVDDVCDGEIFVATALDEDFNGYEKGEPNPETVAGNEPVVTQGILGVSSTESVKALSDTNELSNTGKAAITSFVLGFVLITFVFVVGVRTLDQD
jgi:hypothetical protein